MMVGATEAEEAKKRRSRNPGGKGSAQTLGGVAMSIPARPARPPIPPGPRALVTEDEAAAVLGFSKATLRRHVAQGRLGRVDLPGTRRNMYATADLEAFVATLARTSDVRPPARVTP
jgi:Helix-turn-helix domain